MIRPAPAATSRAFGRRRRSAAPAGGLGGLGGRRWPAPPTSDRIVSRPGERDERQQAEEDVAPADELADETGERRADDAGQHPGRRERREHPRPQPLGQAAPDRDVRDRRDRPGAEALDEPGETSTCIDGARPPMSRPMANRPSPSGERAGQARRVDDAADDRDPDERAEEERREDPAVELPCRRARRRRSAGPSRPPAPRRRPA